MNDIVEGGADQCSEPSEGGTPPIGERLTCPHIQSLQPYRSARSAGYQGNVWIDANELPYPNSGYALDVGDWHRYPSTSPAQMTAAYAGYAGVERARVIAARGADEAIELLVRAFCRSGQDAVLVCPPTYGLYEISAQAHDVEPWRVGLRPDCSLDLDAIMRAPANVKLVFLCNPNNPTGNLFAPADLLAVVRHFAGRALVVVDEAYIEFCPQATLAPATAGFENLVVVRTLSKAFGLAGVHVGFAIADPAVVEVLRRIIQPYPIPAPCAQIALQALAPEGVARMVNCVQRVTSTRERFAAALRRLDGVEAVLASHTNFVLARFDDCERAWARLLDNGVVARRLDQPGLDATIRFSIGTDAEMAAVLRALRSRAAPEAAGGTAPELG